MTEFTDVEVAPTPPVSELVITIDGTTFVYAAAAGTARDKEIRKTAKRWAKSRLLLEERLERIRLEAGEEEAS